jgi:hypothetical protein
MESRIKTIVKMIVEIKREHIPRTLVKSCEIARLHMSKTGEVGT